MGDRSPVSGAVIAAAVGASTVADAQGRFRLGSDQNPEFTPQRFTIESADHLTREAYVRWQAGLREQIVFDLIPTAAPFSLAFYRALVRNGHEQPGRLEPLRRWTEHPRIYVRSADQNGRAIEPEVMSLVLAAIPQAVSQFTAGRLSVAALESGVDTRAPQPGWITINIVRDPSLPYCGQARVGSDPGEVTLVNDRCNCGSVKISGGLVAHELGHALGFWHVPDSRNVMFDTHPSGCPAVDLTSDERFHAALAYQREPGNLDPDRDTSQASMLTGAASPPAVVFCGRR